MALTRRNYNRCSIQELARIEIYLWTRMCNFPDEAFVQEWKLALFQPPDHITGCAQALPFSTPPQPSNLNRLSTITTATPQHHVFVLESWSVGCCCCCAPCISWVATKSRLAQHALLLVSLVVGGHLPPSSAIPPVTCHPTPPRRPDFGICCSTSSSRIERPD